MVIMNGIVNVTSTQHAGSVLTVVNIGRENVVLYFILFIGFCALWNKSNTVVVVEKPQREENYNDISLLG